MQTKSSHTQISDQTTFKYSKTSACGQWALISDLCVIKISLMRALCMHYSHAKRERMILHDCPLLKYLLCNTSSCFYQQLVTLDRVYTCSFIFSEKFELIKDSESRLSQTDLMARYKMLDGPALDILKRKREYFADPNLDQCSVVKKIEIVQRLGLSLISVFLV